MDETVASNSPEGTSTVPPATAWAHVLERIAPGALRFLSPESGRTLLSLPGDGARVIAVREGHLAALLSLGVRDGRIDHIDGIVDPTKLGSIARALGVGAPPERV